MKFDENDCWKHENCIDAFFFVNYIIKDEEGKANLKGHWLTQGIEHYWLVSEQREIHVNAENYEKWQVYHPEGAFV